MVNVETIIPLENKKLGDFVVELAKEGNSIKMFY